MLVARLVAFTFLNKDVKNNKLTVNHKDGNPANNNIENLEIITLKENIQHGFNTGLYNKNRKKCMLYDKNGFEFKFNSLSEASTWLGKYKNYISSHNSKRCTIRNANGEIFKYKII